MPPKATKDDGKKGGKKPPVKDTGKKRPAPPASSDDDEPAPKKPKASDNVSATVQCSGQTKKPANKRCGNRVRSEDGSPKLCGTHAKSPLASAWLAAATKAPEPPKKTPKEKDTPPEKAVPEKAPLKDTPPDKAPPPTKKPDTVKTKPNTVKTKPNTVKTKPDTVKTKPDTVKTKSASKQWVLPDKIAHPFEENTKRVILSWGLRPASIYWPPEDEGEKKPPAKYITDELRDLLEELSEVGGDARDEVLDHLGSRGDEDPMIAYRNNKGHIVTCNLDSSLQITTNNKKNWISIFRKPDAEGGSSVYIDLPKGSTAIVNGRVFENKDTPRYRLGPLRFSVIEICGFPILFWRGKIDLKYEPPADIRKLTRRERHALRRQAVLDRNSKTRSIAARTIKAPVDDQSDSSSSSDVDAGAFDGDEDERRDHVDSVLSSLKESDDYQTRVSEFYEHLDNLPGMDEKSLEENPCKYFIARRRSLQQFQKRFPRPELSDPHEEDLWFTWGEYLTEDQVTLGIASVVGAIDQMTSAVATTEPKYHTGGFALAGYLSINMACEHTDEDWDFLTMPLVSRSRRCWLMPLLISRHLQAALHGVEHDDGDASGGHTVLVIIQEEKDNRPTAYFVDSYPEFVEGGEKFLYGKIKQIASRLNWNSPRNVDPVPDDLSFTAGFHMVRVAEQTNGFACGLHTVLNAWIFALGLTPNPDFDLTDALGKVLRKLVFYGYDGLLDWKTLVSWLFCNKVVKQTSLDAVQDNRRFETTHLITTANDYVGYINEIRSGEELPLLEIPEDEHPYDFSNNVVFDKEDLTKFLSDPPTAPVTSLKRSPSPVPPPAPIPDPHPNRCCATTEKDGKPRCKRPGAVTVHTPACGWPVLCSQHGNKANKRDEFLKNHTAKYVKEKEVVEAPAEELPVEAPAGELPAAVEAPTGELPVAIEAPAEVPVGAPAKELPVAHETEAWEKSSFPKDTWIRPSIWDVPMSNLMAPLFGSSPFIHFPCFIPRAPIWSPLWTEAAKKTEFEQKRAVKQMELSLAEYEWKDSKVLRDAVTNIRTVNRADPKYFKTVIRAQRGDKKDGAFVVSIDKDPSQRPVVRTLHKTGNPGDEYRGLNVTVNGGTDQVRIRQVLADDAKRTVCHIIDVPQNSSVMVNGKVFTNVDSHSFIIGPLFNFTLIELTGIPVFFWNREENWPAGVFRKLPKWTAVEQKKREEQQTRALSPPEAWIEYTNHLTEFSPPSGSSPEIPPPLKPKSISTSLGTPAEVLNARKSIQNLRKGRMKALKSRQLSEKISDADIFTSYQEVLAIADKMLDDDTLDKNPCEYFHWRFQNLKFFQDECPRSDMNTGACKDNRDHRGDRVLQDYQVNMGIQSVVFSINADEPAGSGLAFASSVHITQASTGSDTQFRESGFGDSIIVARPRRCWLLPLVLANQLLRDLRTYQHIDEYVPNGKIGHIILAVIQEEENPDPDAAAPNSFAVYFLDSAKQYTAYRNGAHFLHQIVKRIAERFKWDSHRNPDPQYANEYHYVNVPQQQGGTLCGYHTILNAWIMAMGLTPTPTWNKAEHYHINKEIIDMVLLAHDGLLDWKTLMAWFMCRGIVKEKSFKDVHENRRFESTTRMTDELNIYEQAQVVKTADDFLASSDFPYDYEFNVNFDITQINTVFNDLRKPTAPASKPTDKPTDLVGPSTLTRGFDHSYEWDDAVMDISGLDRSESDDMGYEEDTSVLDSSSDEGYSSKPIQKAVSANTDPLAWLGRH